MLDQDTIEQQKALLTEHRRRLALLGSGRISNGKLRFTVRENQNGLHPSIEHSALPVFPDYIAR